jgi:hypothetical protein
VSWAPERQKGDLLEPAACAKTAPLESAKGLMDSDATMVDLSLALPDKFRCPEKSCDTGESSGSGRAQVGGESGEEALEFCLLSFFAFLANLEPLLSFLAETFFAFFSTSFLCL